MQQILNATLSDGKTIPYVLTDDPPRGGMKYTYFAPDRSYVVQFYNQPRVARDINVQRRIEAIIGKYNPTKPESHGGARGNDAKTAEYFSRYFCWPLAIVTKPEFGIVCPTYPKNFFFKSSDSIVLNIGGKDKKSNWFTSKNRKYLNPATLGDMRSTLQMSIILARAVRRMHQAGLAHSDLSNNNVLIDPTTGTCVVIDIDSLVVPGLYPPEVAGTRGYIAPEVLTTLQLPANDPKRNTPSSYTDLHALAVLFYEYLFLRHPLVGPKIYSTVSAEMDDYFALGPRATFIEHPNDRSNRPPNLKVAIKDLGPILESLFIRTFVSGLHQPPLRPTAMEWEKGLVKTWDLLYPCDNARCEQKFFVLHDINKPICPYCGTRVRREIVRFKLKAQMRGRKGQWQDVGQLNVYDNLPLFKWHIYSGLFPDEKIGRDMVAYASKYNGGWILVNSNIEGMQSPSGNLVPKGQAISLKNGTVFLASREQNGMLIEVAIRE